MTREALVTALAAIEHRLATRVQIVRIIIDEKGHEIGRFTRPRDSHIGEPYSSEERDNDPQPKLR